MLLNHSVIDHSVYRVASDYAWFSYDTKYHMIRLVSTQDIEDVSEMFEICDIKANINWWFFYVLGKNMPYVAQLEL